MRRTARGLTTSRLLEWSSNLRGRQVDRQVLHGTLSRYRKAIDFVNEFLSSLPRKGIVLNEILITSFDELVLQCPDFPPQTLMNKIIKCYAMNYKPRPGRQLGRNQLASWWRTLCAAWRRVTKTIVPQKSRADGHLYIKQLSVTMGLKESSPSRPTMTVESLKALQLGVFDKRVSVSLRGRLTLTGFMAIDTQTGLRPGGVVAPALALLTSSDLEDDCVDPAFARASNARRQRQMGCRYGHFRLGVLRNDAGGPNLPIGFIKTDWSKTAIGSGRVKPLPAAPRIIDLGAWQVLTGLMLDRILTPQQVATFLHPRYLGNNDCMKIIIPPSA